MKFSNRVLKERMNWAMVDSGHDIVSLSESTGLDALRLAYIIEKGVAPSCYEVFKIATELDVSLDWITGRNNKIFSHKL